MEEKIIEHLEQQISIYGYYNIDIKLVEKIDIQKYKIIFYDKLRNKIYTIIHTYRKQLTISFNSNLIIRKVREAIENG